MVQDTSVNESTEFELWLMIIRQALFFNIPLAVSTSDAPLSTAEDATFLVVSTVDFTVFATVSTNKATFV